MAGRAVLAASTTLLVVALTAVSAPVRAEPPRPWGRVLVAPASGRNLSASIVLRARGFLFSALSMECPSCQLIDTGGAAAQASPIDGVVAAALARQWAADFVLALDLDHTQGLTHFTLAAYRRDPATGWPAKPELLTQTTTQGPDATWGIISGLAGRLYRPVAATMPPAPGPPITAFGLPPRRVFVSGAVGVLTQLSTAGGDDRLLPGFQLSIAHHADGSLIDARLDFATQDRERRTAFGLSYSVRATEAWSFGLAASWVWMHLGGRGANGPAVAPMVGYLLLIPGGPSFRCELAYALNLFREQEMDRLIPGSDAAHWSHGPQLMLGVVL
jgi:hypothetical protein